MAKAAVVERKIKLAGRDFTLRFDFKALGVLEELYDKSASEIIAGFTKPGPNGKPVANLRIKDLQRVIYAGLTAHHPEVTVDGVIDLMDATLEQGGTMDGMLGSALAAFEAGQDAGDDEGDDNGRPQTAAAEADAT